MQDFWVSLRRLPCPGSDALNILECAEEALVRGEARLLSYLPHFQLGMFTQELLGVGYTILTDELRERTATGIVDTGRQHVGVNVEYSSHVSQFQVAVQEKLLLFQQLADTVHQLLVGLSGR